MAQEEEEEASEQKRVAEVVVYGQRNEATVSDTSISITAMDQSFLEDMGMQGPNEMVNFIPATTRTDWDIKIRGVGRNFRGLGGDPDASGSTPASPSRKPRGAGRHPPSSTTCSTRPTSATRTWKTAVPAMAATGRSAWWHFYPRFWGVEFQYNMGAR